MAGDPTADAGPTPESPVPTSDGGDNDAAAAENGDDSVGPGAGVVDEAAELGGGGVGGGGDGDGEGFVVGTGLSDEERSDVIVGASVIGGVAFALIAVACAAARYNAVIADRCNEGDDDDDWRSSPAGRGGGGSGRGRLPKYRFGQSSRKMELGI